MSSPPCHPHHVLPSCPSTMPSPACLSIILPPSCHPHHAPHNVAPTMFVFHDALTMSSPSRSATTSSCPPIMLFPSCLSTMPPSPCHPHHVLPLGTPIMFFCMSPPSCHPHHVAPIMCSCHPHHFLPQCRSHHVVPSCPAILSFP